MLYDFTQIKQKFNSLNEVATHFINSNDICTPMECVKEMLDSLPENFWKKENLKILDSCCGNGNFHAYAALKTPLRLISLKYKLDRKSTRLNSSHVCQSRMPSSA